MTDPRNVAHDKKVQQEKKHRHEEIAPGAEHAVQPGKKPHMAPQPDKAVPEAEADSPSADLTQNAGMTQATPAPVSSTPERPELPDHLAVDPRSPHHHAAVFEHEIGIRFNGKERFDVEEYCISGGFIKVPAGKTVDRRGRPLLITLKGQVEAFYR